MGALFSHLCTQARQAGVALGRALGVNTLAAAAAPPLFGVLLVPALGAQRSLLLVAAAYLALMAPRAWWRVPTAAVAAGLLALVLWAGPLRFVDVPDGGHISSYQEGVMAAVSVVEDADGVARLRINNRQQEGSSASQLADARQALLPLLLHPAPHRALFLGLGTGVTATAAAQDPQLQVDAAELLPEVMVASARFDGALVSSPANGAADASTVRHPHLMAADARRVVRAPGPLYDLIVADNFHPARSGSGALYTVEHFAAVRQRLAAGGLFCQWLPLHQLDLATLRSIVQSFVAVNPGAFALLATNSLETPTLGLVARADQGRIDTAAVQARIDGIHLPLPLAAFGLPDRWAVLGSIVADAAALRAFAGDAALNTDDHPVVAYRAPRITYAPDSLPRDRLLALLQSLRARPSAVVAGSDDDNRRLAGYWLARNRFLDAGRHIQPVADVRQMLAQTREPLLAVLRTSPDFRPAYDPLLRMATAVARVDSDSARDLLLQLVHLQPARPEAAQALLQLAAAPVGSAAALHAAAGR